jgi:hypothetical protein
LSSRSPAGIYISSNVVFEEQVCTKTPGDAVTVTVVNVHSPDAERTVRTAAAVPCLSSVNRLKLRSAGL